MGKYFGTDGFRGKVGEVLTAAHAYEVGRYLGHRYRGQNILVGRDTRLSGEMLATALTAGATASGAHVTLLGVVPTACVSYLTSTRTCAAGVMLSASHNPYGDNGIKLFAGNGEKPTDEELDRIEEHLDGGQVPYAVESGVGRVSRAPRLCTAYIKHLWACGICPIGRLRIGLDCANGSASYLARRLFDGLGIETVVTGNSPDGVNINDGVGSTHMAHLAALVRERGLDAGFAFDGDADRCIAVDERGRVVDGDGILYLSAMEMRRMGICTPVVGTVLSGMGLESALGNAGISLVRAAVGDRYVREEMKRCGASLGGEKSGHIIYASHAVTGDGLLTAIKVLGAMARQNLTLSRLVADLPIYPRAEANVAAKHPTRLLQSERLQGEIRAAERGLAGRGRLLVRASGTEPLLRIMCEAEDNSLCCQVTSRLREVCEDVKSED